MVKNLCAESWTALATRPRAAIAANPVAAIFPCEGSETEPYLPFSSRRVSAGKTFLSKFDAGIQPLEIRRRGSLAWKLEKVRLSDSVSFDEFWRWRGSQVVRPRSAKPLCVGSIPTRASKIPRMCGKELRELEGPLSVKVSVDWGGESQPAQDSPILR